MKFVQFYSEVNVYNEILISLVSESRVRGCHSISLQPSLARETIYLLFTINRRPKRGESIVGFRIRSIEQISSHNISDAMAQNNRIWDVNRIFWIIFGPTWAVVPPSFEFEVYVFHLKMNVPILFASRIIIESVILKLSRCWTN